MPKGILIGAACASVAVILGALWFWPAISRALTPGTTGSIYVSGPQVYTRERLVNDRYREDAWLLKELIDSPERSFGITMSTSTTGANVVAMTGAIGQPDPPAALDAKKSDALAVVAVEVSPHDHLNALRTYREQIRTLMIENQLDDRHDLRGNSLYRLRFDAAVLPGVNTQTGARITVSVLPPENLLGPGATEELDNVELRKNEDILSHLTQLQKLGPEQRVVWDRVYSRWLESVGKRFEDSRKAVRLAYESNRFTSYDYDRLLNSAKSDARNLWFGIEALKQDKKAKLALAKLSSAQRQVIETGLRDEILEPRAESRPFLSRMRSTNAKNDAARSDDPGHQFFKAEINRLIDILNQESVLWYKFTFALLSVADGPAPQTGKQDAGVPAGQPTEGCGDLKDYGTIKPIQTTSPPFVPSLQYLLDREFEPQLSNSVLGLGPNRVNVSSTLRQFAAGVSNFGADGPAFRFIRQSPSFVVTDNKECFPEAIKPSIREMQSEKRPVYVLQHDLDAIGLLLHNYDPQADIDELVAAKWGPPTRNPASVPAHVDTLFVQAGLINFIRMAGHQVDVFSYAFTPSEPDELNAIQSRDEESRLLAARATGTALKTQAAGSLNVEQEQLELRRRNALRKLVVSFGEQPNSVTAKFGWVIQPQEPIEGNRYRHRASQTSLTALVSLPAWWEEIRVKIEPSWDGESGVAQKPQEYVIVLPVNFETVDANLFESNDRSPVVSDWATNGLTVTACEKTEILIPGRRLWRSTVVTLGGQRANEIYVMPDMNGVIATFTKLDFPSAWTDLSQDYRVPLTVWTSQGSAPPQWVTFKKPATMQRGCVKETK